MACKSVLLSKGTKGLKKGFCDMKQWMRINVACIMAYRNQFRKRIDDTCLVPVFKSGGYIGLN